MGQANMLGGISDGASNFANRVEEIRGIGLPWATLILSGVLSAAAFGIQMVQHSFEMRQANVENGFKFYFDNRTQLKERADADKEMSLLKLIGNAFPNVYCDVRQDVYERTSSAEVGVITAAAGAAPFGEADRKNIVSFLLLHDRPTSPQFATGVISVVKAALSPNNGTDARACDSLVENAPKPPAPVVTAAASAPSGAAAPSAPAEEKLDKAVDTKQKADQAAHDVELQNKRAIAAAQGLSGIQVYRVYFHIGIAGSKHARPLDIADQFRDELANQQFRVMQGVQLVDAKILPNNPEVRYFGPEEKEAAEKLAQYLTDKFKSEHFTFTAKSIGEAFPYMNPDNIEVWLPDPAPSQQRNAPAPRSGS